ncbi:MAG: hypothetical protein M3433_02685 [Actinomycetota bacterium]|nr:hypothetical protein [Actinomycetota bacterium]
MNIEWVIPCRFVEVHDNLATIVGAGIDTFWVPQDPRVVGLMFAIRVTALADELGEDQQHPIAERIRDPNGAVIQEIEGQFAAGLAGEVANPDWLQGIAVPAGAQFEAAVEGTYTVTHKFDDSEHSSPLHVVHGFPPGAAPPAA